MMAAGPIISWQIEGEELEAVTGFIFLGSKITADVDCSHENKRCLLLGRKVMTNLDSVLKSSNITFLTRVHIVKTMAFPVIMYWMWEVDHKEGWVLKNWCFQILQVLEKSLENPLDCKEIKSVNPGGNQPWTFTGKTDAEAEAPIFWPLDEKSWLTGKDPDAGKLKAREGGGRGWDGYIASPTQWIWIWANSGR